MTELFGNIESLTEDEASCGHNMDCQCEHCQARQARLDAVVHAEYGGDTARCDCGDCRRLIIAARTARTTYSAVVESGSCSTDYRRWEEREHCGHAHKTYEAAERCLATKTRMYCQHGRIAGLPCRHCLSGTARAQNCSAAWYNGRIHNQDGERVGQ
jgi:hypothetical protein